MKEMNLKIKIAVDGDTRKVVLLKDEVNVLGKSFNDADSKLGSLAKNIDIFAKLAAGTIILNQAVGSLVRSGIEHNKTMEELTNSLTTLGVATSSNVTTTGVMIGQTQKYAMAADEAAVAMQKLQAINADTPHTLNQTVEIYKSMYSSMKMAGVSTDQMVELTKKVSIAAGSAGVEFNQLLAGVDGLAKGQVEANSEFGRFLDNMGLSNDVLKNSKDIYKTINDALVDIKGGFGSFEEASSNAQNAFSSFAGALTEPLFDGLKDGLNESVGLFDALTKKITDARTAAMGWSQMATLEHSSVKMGALSSELAEYKRVLSENDGALWFGLTDEQVQYTKRKIAEISHEIELESRRIAKKYEESFKVGSLAPKNAPKPDDETDAKKHKEREKQEKKHLAALLGLQEDFYTKKSLLEFQNELLRADIALVETKVSREFYENNTSESFSKESVETQKISQEFDVNERVSRSVVMDDVDLKPFLKLEHSYAKDLEAFANVVGAKEELDRLYNEQRYLLGSEVNAKLVLDEQKSVQEANAKRVAAQRDLTFELLELSNDWYVKESLLLSQKYDEYEAAGVERVELEKWVNASVANLEERRINERVAADEKLLKEQSAYWDTLTKNINKAMDEQFFDAMTGKFTSFGDWLKDFWSATTHSLARGVSKTLADSLIGGADGGGIQNVFKGFGNFAGLTGARASLVGTTLGAEQMNALGYDGVSQSFVSSGGTSFDASGKVSVEGSDLTSLVSSAKGIFNLGSSLYSPSSLVGSLANSAAGAGLDGTASFLGGSANVLGGGGLEGLSGASYAGGMLTQVVGSAGIGYAVGSLGDKVFGAETKAGAIGAIGATVGTLILPGVGTAIGAVLGSAIGGLFGKTKLKESGFAFEDSSADDVNAQAYLYYQKKSWFSKKSWYEYSELSAKEMKQIEGVFETYDYLFYQLGESKKVFLEAGNYSPESFVNALAEDFLEGFYELDATVDTKEVYNYWSAYAKEIDKSIVEALSGAVGSYSEATRSFREWTLKDDELARLEYRSTYLNDDLRIMKEQLGVPDVSVETFLQEYKDAIKEDFTSETIAGWKALGDALMEATDASDAYIESLKKLSDASLPKDMMLSKVTDKSQEFGSSSGKVLDEMLNSFNKMLREMQTQTKIAELSAGR